MSMGPTHTRGFNRKSGRVAIVGMAGLFVLAIGALPAQAHAQLVETNPDEGAVLAEPPGEIVLNFDSSVRPVPEGVRLFDGAGGLIEGEARAEGTTVVFTPNAEIPGGAAVLEWSVISDDQHAIRGALTFFVGQRSAVDFDVTGTSAPVWLVAVSTSVMYVGLLLGAGLAIFAHHSTAIPGAYGAVRRPAASLLGIGLLGVLVLATLDSRLATGGPDTPLLTAGTAPSLIAGVIGVVSASIGLARGSRLLGYAGLAAIAASLASVGHSRATDPLWLLIASDIGHVAAASVWGGVLIGLGLANRRTGSAIRQMAVEFSPVAAWSMVVVGLTGTVMAWRILGSTAAVLGTTHGRLAMVKVVIFGLVTFAGASNRFQTSRRSRADGTAERRIRRNVTLETIGMVLVLVVTGYLVTQSPKLVLADRVEQGAVQTAFGEGTIIVELGYGKGDAGFDTIQVQFLDALGRSFQPVGEPLVEISQVDSERAATVHSLEFDDGRYNATMDLPVDRTWDLSVRARVDTFSEETTTLTLDGGLGNLAAQTGIIVTGPMFPAPFRGAENGVAYMSIESSTDDRLMSVSSPACSEITLHESTVGNNGVASMEPRAYIDLPEGETVALTAGSLHLMCGTPDPTLERDSAVPFVLITERGIRLTVAVNVVEYSDIAFD